MLELCNIRAFGVAERRIALDDAVGNKVAQLFITGELIYQQNKELFFK